VLAAGVAAYPPLTVSGLEQLIALGAVLGLAALALGLAGLNSAIPCGLALIGAEYAAWFALRGGGIDTRAPLYAAGLIVVGELAYWVRDRRSAAAPDTELEVRRFVALLITAMGTIAAGTVVLGVSSASIGGGVALEALGVACAVGFLVLVARLVRADRDLPPPL
jgi:hypothetical protein